MKKQKRLIAVVLMLVLTMAMSVPALAAEGDGFTDVTPGIWYAEAVEYVQANGLMNGTADNLFSPGETTSRAMLATILYRIAGSPAVAERADFRDVADGAYYADAVAWAAASGVVSGYGDGLFGSDDPVSREQIAAILWRYEGSPAADAGAGFSDESAISAYAAVAVDWASANGVANGLTDGRFDPQGNATRAQVAVILQNFMSSRSGQTTEPSTNPADQPTADSSTLVIYFSATGSTEAVAGYIAESLSADRYEITPAVPYTSADLDWGDDTSRVSAEHEDPASRPAITGALPELAEYETIFLGYPIWWGEAPNIVRTFMEQVDLSGKTVIPFCTSSSSGLGSSAETLRAFAPNASWQAGQRFSSNVSRTTVEEWVESLNIS